MSLGNGNLLSLQLWGLLVLQDPVIAPWSFSWCAQQLVLAADGIHWLPLWGECVLVTFLTHPVGQEHKALVFFVVPPWKWSDLQQTRGAGFGGSQE